MRRFILLMAMTVLLTCASAIAQYNPFAGQIVDISLNEPNVPKYLPAPGQRINLTTFNNALKALSKPSGGGTETPNNGDVVTLGGFGGRIVLAFDHDVEDNEANPMGLDAIVFTNTQYVLNNSQLHWSELATIEIMPELNGNSLCGDDPNEKWFLIPGSHLSNGDSYRSIIWDANQTPAGYPAYEQWPDSYETAAHELTPTYQTILTDEGVLVNPNYDDGDPNNDNQEGYWGYAEYTPTLKLGDRDGDNSVTGYGDDPDMPAELFYTVPDDPVTVGITPGSCGGDAFDIKWAVDTESWHTADLSSFRYIRITTAVDQYLPELGEVSAEIDAVADVRPIGDADGDGDVDLSDLSLLCSAWLTDWQQTEFNPAVDWVLDNRIDMADFQRFAWGWSAYYH